MKKRWLLVVSLALVLITVGLFGCRQAVSTTSSQQEGIWVTGQGKVTTVPDIASLSLGIEAQAETVAEAMTQATAAMNKVMDTLTDNGVAEKDIQTHYFNIRKITRWDRDKEEEVVIGYRVTNIVTAKIRDIDKAGSIIDAVVKAGGDLTRVDSISFSVDDPSAYHEEARAKAIADAKSKAEQLAELAEVILGKPTYISEGGIQTPTPRVMAEEMVLKAAAATPITPGEMEISLTVQIVYAILK